MDKIPLGLFVLAVFFTEVTFAQVLGWGQVLPALTEEDIEIISKTGRVEMVGKSEGSVLKWTNPRSGAFGTVTLRRRFFFNEQECRELLHSIEVKGNEPWYYLSEICLTDGTWKLLEPPRQVRKPVTKSK